MSLRSRAFDFMVNGRRPPQRNRPVPKDRSSTLRPSHIGNPGTHGRIDLPALYTPRYRGSVTINPYTPGFGQRPLVVVGRERQLARGHETLLTVAGTGRASTSPLVLLGVRGIGKTVALGLLRDDAEREG